MWQDIHSSYRYRITMSSDAALLNQDPNDLQERAAAAFQNVNGEQGTHSKHSRGCQLRFSRLLSFHEMLILQSTEEKEAKEKGGSKRKALAEKKKCSELNLHNLNLILVWMSAFRYHLAFWTPNCTLGLIHCSSLFWFWCFPEVLTNCSSKAQSSASAQEAGLYWNRQGNTDRINLTVVCTAMKHSALPTRTLLGCLKETMKTLQCIKRFTLWPFIPSTSIFTLIQTGHRCSTPKCELLVLGGGGKAQMTFSSGNPRAELWNGAKT